MAWPGHGDEDDDDTPDRRKPPAARTPPKDVAEPEESKASSSSGPSANTFSEGRAIADRSHYDAYLYHGIGFDLTKLVQIASTGAVVSAARATNITGFAQGHANPINQATWISTSSFGSPAFNSYNTQGLSFMVPRSLSGLVTRAYVRGSVDGEVQVQDEIPLSSATPLMVPANILDTPLKDLTTGVLTGSRPAPDKVDAFIARVGQTFGYQHTRGMQLLRQRALELETALSSAPASVQAAATKLDKLLSAYQHNAVVSSGGGTTLRSFFAARALGLAVQSVDFHPSAPSLPPQDASSSSQSSNPQARPLVFGPSPPLASSGPANPVNDDLLRAQAMAARVQPPPQSQPDQPMSDRPTSDAPPPRSSRAPEPDRMRRDRGRDRSLVVNPSAAERTRRDSRSPPRDRSDQTRRRSRSRSRSPSPSRSHS